MSCLRHFFFCWNFLKIIRLGIVEILLDFSKYVWPYNLQESLFDKYPNLFARLLFSTLSSLVIFLWCLQLFTIWCFGPLPFFFSLFHYFLELPLDHHFRSTRPKVSLLTCGLINLCLALRTPCLTCTQKQYHLNLWEDPW